MRLLRSALLLAAALTVLAPASQAQSLIFRGDLSGLNEATPNASPGTGLAVVTIDPTLHAMRVQITFDTLLGFTSASHIHASTVVPLTGTAGVATQVPNFTGFPLGVSSGSYDHLFDTLDLATYNPTFVTNNGGTAASAEAALFSGITSGRSYLNIHTNVFPGGEIRGFLVAAPEPGSVALLAVGLAGMGAVVRRRTRR